ncbi:transcription initiation factor TFIID subunit 6-like isoform X2 [Arctopsyche grandis]|uniref:transcription initiation factor TFIID subunit 6-like isoform X2 n=1 Tax=Arctopsyche grandis TaxID=121162 RepID=UPI00406D8059
MGSIGEGGGGSGVSSSSGMSCLSAESIKVMGEGSGAPALGDEAARELAEDVSFKVRAVLQDALHFMHHARRQRCLPDDINHALRLRNIEPQYGFVQKDFTPFRFASGGGRELHFMEEKELDLNEILSSAAPKIPLDVSLRAHWLCVDGVQPTVPENPPPNNKDLQKLESVDPLTKLTKTNDKDAAGKPGSGKMHKLKNVETVHVKQLATHELSVEQQLYYKEITEACVGSDEAKRAEALQSLACDPGLHEMLPRMCTFISEGVKVNVVQNNLALLIYLMRMVKALLDNQSLYLEKYLHELIPSVSTCIVSRQLCMRPEMDNHWALRDFASRLMAQICKNFNTSTNNVQTRVTRLFSKALNPPPPIGEVMGGKELSSAEKLSQQNERTPLASLYGAIQGLSELGAEVIKVFIIPRVKWIGDRIESNIDAPVNADKLAAGHIKHLLVKVLPPVIKTVRNPPDQIDDYRRDFGYLGTTLYNIVSKNRMTPSTTPSTTSGGTTPTTPSATPLSVTVVASTPNIVPPPPTPTFQRQTSFPAAVTSGRTVVVNPSTPPIGRALASVAASAVQSPAQKYVILTQKPPAAVQQQQQQPTAPVSMVPKPIYIGQGNAPPPPELDDLSHLA